MDEISVFQSRGHENHGLTSEGPIAKEKEYQINQTLQTNFRKYLTQVFEDLCLRDNGQTKPESSAYTFMKVVFTKSITFL